MMESMNTKKSFRRFQLKAMGFTAILIGPVVLFATTVIYHLPFPSSISETATIANRTDAILPFCLGALSLFSLTYAIAHAYERIDKILMTGMFSGFTAVALQMCKSPYIESEQVGVLGLSPDTSNILHCSGAVIGFGCMILWIMLCFTKSDKTRAAQTKEKRLRDTCYFWLGTIMVLSLCMFIYNSIGWLGNEFPVVFVTECLMLTFGGIACLIKGGLFFTDKSEGKFVADERSRNKKLEDILS
ncbi:MAG: hypothetical protein LBH71_00705 [Oscillospiraceae bacterium]|nr:hypothetical protein [Oscillospiraceae bacterium]